jgi:hypothetical protein
MRAFLLLVLAASLAHAEAPKDKRKVVRFDGDNIDGDLVRPEGDLVAARPALELPSLIEPPKSFEDARRRTRLAAAAALSRGSRP